MLALTAAMLGFFGPLSSSITRLPEYASPFALAESFPRTLTTSRSSHPALPTVPLQVELSAASMTAIRHVAREFATAAADLGVMLSHSAVHGTIRYNVWGSKRALQLFVSRCMCAKLVTDSANAGSVVVTWRQHL
mmetsp:Transcript_19935/g.45985  ORF Transcript_19935/g.45985 Transcript_19935/m.45985 type:complete len:135 (-) Transcript_19935:408-812(-)|eukprot:CAMPEP_0119373734 /NCGR_PEP_ID=MMETSP1334-20130426/27565_1 /TAXON_ID=127549 /ORGANISM="Calcidiscus leptoporus, Strain RCC1130" /LENGTH=134 /DNA_ID=CAMNT_0007391593 /DNA_START=79 /DNA_END=483 /DNA_ORIENTATION=+